MIETDQPNGHRKMTAERLRSEYLAKSFSGFGEFAPRQALRIVRDYAAAHLGHSALRLYTFMLKLCEKRIRECPEDFEFYRDAAHFSFWAKNDTITSKTGLKTRTIQRALRQLEDANLIWCNDNGNRNRKIENGICLLPAFCRLHELLKIEEDDKFKLLSARQERYQLTKAKAELIALRDFLQLTDSTLIDDLIALADSTMKRAGTTGFMDAMLVITQSLVELKAMSVALSGPEMSPQRDNFDAPITYKILSLKKEVAALREMESLLGSEDITQDSLALKSEDKIVAPKPDHVVSGIKALIKHNRFPSVEQEGLSDEAYVRRCGTEASKLIRINPHAVRTLRDRFGDLACASLLVHAASDPKIRYPGAWAANFAYASFEKPVDLRSSFFRMVKELDRPQEAIGRC